MDRPLDIRPMEGATNFYEKMGEWQGDMPQAPFSAEVFKFIQAVGRVKRS